MQELVNWLVVMSGYVFISHCPVYINLVSLRWRHNGYDGVSNHQSRHCLRNRLFGCRSKKTSKLRVTGLCAGISPGNGEFPAQMASNAENVSIWWRNHVLKVMHLRHAFCLVCTVKLPGFTACFVKGLFQPSWKPKFEVITSAKRTSAGKNAQTVTCELINQVNKTSVCETYLPPVDV